MEHRDILPYLQEIVSDKYLVSNDCCYVSVCCLFKIHFNSIPLSLSRSFKCRHLFRPSEYDYVFSVRFWYFLCVRFWALSFSVPFISLIILAKIKISMNLPTLQFSAASLSLIPSQIQIFSLNNHNLCSSLDM